MTQRDGRRWSAADAYLHPARSRPNLEVLTDARAIQVVVEAGRAAGVRYLRRGAEETARADGEVIVAAGAIGSPHLLMLSGIGPADHLHDHGILVHVDSPGVGANLSDHPVVTAMWAHPAHTGPVGGVQPGQPGPVAAAALRPADLQRGRGRRVQPDPALASRARPAVARAAHAVQRKGLADPQTRACPC